MHRVRGLAQAELRHRKDAPGHQGDGLGRFALLPAGGRSHHVKGIGPVGQPGDVEAEGPVAVFAVEGIAVLTGQRRGQRQAVHPGIGFQVRDVHRQAVGADDVRRVRLAQRDLRHRKGTVGDELEGPGRLAVRPARRGGRHGQGAFAGSQLRGIDGDRAVGSAPAGPFAVLIRQDRAEFHFNVLVIGRVFDGDHQGILDRQLALAHVRRDLGLSKGAVGDHLDGLGRSAVLIAVVADRHDLEGIRAIPAILGDLQADVIVASAHREERLAVQEPGPVADNAIIGAVAIGHVQRQVGHRHPFAHMGLVGRGEPRSGKHPLGDDFKRLRGLAVFIAIGLGPDENRINALVPVADIHRALQGSPVRVFVVAGLPVVLAVVDGNVIFQIVDGGNIADRDVQRFARPQRLLVQRDRRHGQGGNGLHGEGDLRPVVRIAVAADGDAQRIVAGRHGFVNIDNDQLGGGIPLILEVAFLALFQLLRAAQDAGPVRQAVHVLRHIHDLVFKVLGVIDGAAPAVQAEARRFKLYRVCAHLHGKRQLHRRAAVGVADRALIDGVLGEGLRRVPALRRCVDGRSVHSPLVAGRTHRAAAEDLERRRLAGGNGALRRALRLRRQLIVDDDCEAHCLAVRAVADHALIAGAARLGTGSDIAGSFGAGNFSAVQLPFVGQGGFAFALRLHLQRRGFLRHKGEVGHVGIGPHQAGLRRDGGRLGRRSGGRSGGRNGGRLGRRFCRCLGGRFCRRLGGHLRCLYGHGAGGLLIVEGLDGDLGRAGGHGGHPAVPVHGRHALGAAGPGEGGRRLVRQCRLQLQGPAHVEVRLRNVEGHLRGSLLHRHGADV